MTPLEALTVALDDLADHGRRTPCQLDPDRWTSEDYRTRAEAAHDCHPCPVLALCAVAGDSEPAHVWGGSDRTPTTRKAIA